MDLGFLAVAAICEAQQVKPRILFATQFGALVIMREGPEDHAENEFLQELTPLSSSTSEASTTTSTPRDARYGLPKWSFFFRGVA